MICALYPKGSRSLYIGEYHHTEFLYVGVADVYLHPSILLNFFVTMGFT
jgi:hypothetical protein